MYSSSFLSRSRPRGLLIALVTIAACAAEPPESPRDGELMFDLDEDEVAWFHDHYVPEDELELTRARLTAPFDCRLFDDFCAQVGRDAAIEITGMQLDLAFDGASWEELNDRTLAWISEAMDAHEPDDDELVFRGSGPWAIRTKGDYRLKVRNGITTPIAGDREAWTQSKFQKKDWLGIWWQEQADQLCANTGVNTQVRTVGPPGDSTTIESKDPAKICSNNDGNLKQITLHSRNNGFDNGTFWESYMITADGCGSANNNGKQFGICAVHHVAIF